MDNRQAFDLALRQLRTKLLQMGEMVAGAIQQAVQALEDANLDAAAEVRDNDKNVNHMEHEIEDLCIRLIATQQPVATDLRKIVAGMRIASDLERIGDLAVDVAKTVIRLDGEKPVETMPEIKKMAAVTDSMITDALNAYVENRTDLARKLADEDDKVDKTYRQIVENLFLASGQQPEAVPYAMYVAFIGRYLERVGDHATNIGESVIYIVSGDRSDLN
ncbi:phosphate signaling complex protein PhoU [Alicyclobacillus sp. SO9]|uniref:phosphate signaling complex protein PhoU n=1 Tax=Alicyclobacillus sp. SO9 TaxID=2665646 RepID=UPI0018E6F00B|nr:phosphate signaling complex protein PhoU [Alicyclobacillus sp. SO9]QQE78165.1 phosphate signaling complex protein PhoU [Alicyclobacillus sp. SO9]